MTADQESAAAHMPCDCTFTPAGWHVLSRYWYSVAFNHDPFIS